MLLPAGKVHGKERSQACRGVCTRMVMREMLHPSSEEGRRVPDIAGGMHELSRGLAAAAPQPGTEGPEVNASTHFPKPANPKGNQMFLMCLFLLHACGELGKRGNVSVPDGKMYCDLCERNQRGWI